MLKSIVVAKAKIGFKITKSRLYSKYIILLGVVMLLFSKEAVNAQTYKDQDGDGLIEISYIDDLNNIRNNLTGTCSASTCNGYELTKSLDFSSTSSYRSGNVNSSYTTGSGWNPIGTYSKTSTGTAFNATFEGNGYTIDHLYIKRPSTGGIGLFRPTGSTTIIRNIGLTNVSVLGKDYVGALVGINRGTITNSYATGSVSGSEAVGGLVGENNGTITKSYATGFVSGTFYVGGLVGVNNDVTITQSYATGSVSGSVDVGGLVGVNSGTITKSYATGSVSGSEQVGGLVGSHEERTIIQTYATGSVSGSKQVGALVGYNGYSATITYSFWNTDASQTEDGRDRTDTYKRGFGYTEGTIDSKGLTLSDMRVECSRYSTGICQLGDSFIFFNGNLPKLKGIE